MIEIIKEWPLFLQYTFLLVIIWSIYCSIEIILYYIGVIIRGWPLNNDKNNDESEDN
jgi:hypothetical protein